MFNDYKLYQHPTISFDSRSLILTYNNLSTTIPPALRLKTQNLLKTSLLTYTTQQLDTHYKQIEALILQ